MKHYQETIMSRNNNEYIGDIKIRRKEKRRRVFSLLANNELCKRRV